MSVIIITRFDCKFLNQIIAEYSLPTVFFFFYLAVKIILVVSSSGGSGELLRDQLAVIINIPNNRIRFLFKPQTYLLENR